MMCVDHQALLSGGWLCPSLRVTRERAPSDVDLLVFQPPPLSKAVEEGAGPAPAVDDR